MLMTFNELRDFFKAMAGLYSNKVRKEGIDLQAFDDMIVSHECINKGFQVFYTILISRHICIKFPVLR
jgi:hypothetical protein